MSAGHHMRFLPVAAMLVLGLSSVAEARHWRHHGERTSRGEAGFGVAVEQMIHACDEQVAELKKLPFDAVTRTVKPSTKQRQALDQIRSVAAGSADTLAAACPKDMPEQLGGKLDTLSHALDAIEASLVILRPAVTTFYASLDDEQKARLVAMNFYGTGQRKSDPPFRSARSERASDDGTEADGAEAGKDPICRQWVAALRHWPIRKIETEMPLSDDQHAALYELSAAIYRAAGGLFTSCPAEDRLTPLGRLDAKENRLQSLHRGIDAIRPAFITFENSLNDTQMSQLDRVVSASSD